MTKTMILKISTLVIHKEDLPPADEDLVQVEEALVPAVPVQDLVAEVLQVQGAVDLVAEVLVPDVVLPVQADLQAHLHKGEALQARVLPTEILVILQNADLLR